MPPLQFTPLTDLQRCLLDNFYKQHGTRMRAAAEGQQWVARAQAIIAGLSLTPVAQGHWLTGLLVDPQWRGRGVAGQLIDAALAQAGGPTWLFCHPDLLPFYLRLGFSPCQSLPETLAMRLAHYQRSKNLLAMVRSQSSATSSPGNSTSV